MPRRKSNSKTNALIRQMSRKISNEDFPRQAYSITMIQ